MQFCIVTGISGAGKSQAVACLEDLGFFCVDNLPVALLPEFSELCRASRLSRVALGIDAREGVFLKGLRNALTSLKRDGIRPHLLFLDAKDSVILRRYAETRRKHPLGRNPAEGLQRERRMMRELKAASDKILDTTNMTRGGLKHAISALFSAPGTDKLTVSVVSFGYKHGLPLDADLVMDVRFLPNPNDEPRLRMLSGKSPKVSGHVLKSPLTRTFLRRYCNFLEYLLPKFQAEGKSYLTVAVGCTGGRHRSVVIAERLSNFFRQKGLAARVAHRDLNK